MISFLTEASAPGKNTHMTHIEDLVLYGGTEGVSNAIASLSSLAEMLAGSSKASHDVTMKWDGSPAVFAGIDPTDGKFFVAKKGIFNKNPKVYKSVADVKADTSGDLAEKLSISFTYLSKLGITGVIQGDLMFTQKDLRIEKIDDETYITFHPNTIVYAVPKSSDIGKQISRAKLGVVFHTSYSGDSFESMKASYDVDVSKLKPSKDVWFQDATVHDLSGKVTMTEAETKAVMYMLKAAKATAKKISTSVLESLYGDTAISTPIETYGNSLIRQGSSMNEDSAKHYDGFIEWLTVKHDKEIAAKKSPMGKAGASLAKDTALGFFTSNRSSMIAIFDLQKLLVNAKGIIIDKLNSLNKINTFLKTSTGFRVTPSEGFVAIDRIGSMGAVKLVDRLEFSNANFSPDILKGWQR